MTPPSDKKKPPREQPSAPDVMTTKEAAAYLRISSGSLDKLRWSRQGPVYSKTRKVGIRYLRDDLDAYLRTGLVRPLPPPRER